MRDRVGRDTLEFTSGLAIGAALGMAVGGLLMPDRPLPDRMRRRLRRPRRRLEKRAEDAGAATGKAVGRTVRLADELRSFGAEFLTAAREELLEEARRRLRHRRAGSEAGPGRVRPLRERSSVDGDS